jgi:chromate transport protein ChrA
MDLVTLLIFVAIAVIVIVVLYWLLQQVTLEPMIRKLITIALVVIIAVIIIMFLLQMGHMGSVRIGVLTQNLIG